MGSGIGSIESALGKLFREAKQEILLTAYSITSGADILFDWLDIALSRGVEIKMIVNHLEGQPPVVIQKLQGLVKKYQHFYLYDFHRDEWVDLHAKLVVADRQIAIVGSSNLSRRGLLTNYELALSITGQVATDIACAVDSIISKLNVY